MKNRPLLNDLYPYMREVGLDDAYRYHHVTSAPEIHLTAASQEKSTLLTPYVWTCPGGNPLYGVGSFRRRFYTALKNVGQVRKLSPHCCRHTYVTMLQANGVPMETIAALTGHSDIKTTEGYLHQSADTLAKAVEVLNGKAAS